MASSRSLHFRPGDVTGVDLWRLRVELNYIVPASDVTEEDLSFRNILKSNELLGKGGGGGYQTIMYMQTIKIRYRKKKEKQISSYSLHNQRVVYRGRGGTK